ncbi:glycosyltransferase family 2 protein [Leptothoe sp. LEGE 181152]|nr:glycosyltransferase family 2 protein [Leptothoe sp. LEGE 181152]
MTPSPVTVVIPTFNRPDQLLVTLAKIYECVPAPSEVIVHIDANDHVTQAALDNSLFKAVKIIQSDSQMGPGGGRNRAIDAASHELIASFDDDSYPLDQDYFLRLIELFEMFPKAAVIGANIFHIGEPVTPDDLVARWVPDFIGCGCAYRKSVFQQTNGYVPLEVAYGMEEVDLILQLRDSNWKVLNSSWLRVFHNTQLTHHSRPKVTAASIANLALLAYLRYPVSFWWLGIAQCLNRILWLVKNGRLQGILQGITSIPRLIYQHRQQRQPISAQTLQSHLQLHRSQSQTIEIKEKLTYLATQ